MTLTKMPQATDAVIKLLRLRGPFDPKQLPAEIRRSCAEVSVKFALGASTEKALRSRITLFLNARAEEKTNSHFSPDPATAPTAQKAQVRDGEQHGTTTATETIRG